NPARFPKYMDTDGENYRGVHALQILEGSKGWTIDKLQAAAFDSYQPGLAVLIPSLIQAYDALPAGARKSALAEPIGVLRSWNYRWGAQSVAQSLATFWGLARDTTSEQKLTVFEETIARLKRDFGRWQVPWGEINRFQRISPAIANPTFSDASPSIPVPFANGYFGSLASIRSGPKPGTRRWYGD